MSTRTIVHLMRHGEVHNPDGVLYGRLPEYFLSELGHQMAEAAADFLSEERDHPPGRLALGAGSADRRAAVEDPRGADQHRRPGHRGRQPLRGPHVRRRRRALRRPANWWKLRNPFRPSWGEPYVHIAERMRAAIADAREAARGHEAVIVSHQLPVWIARRSFEEKSYVPRSAQAPVLPRQHHQPDLRRRPLRRLHLQRAGRPNPPGGAEERQEVRRRRMIPHVVDLGIGVAAGCSRRLWRRGDGRDRRVGM